jgi:hypothetical protein
MFFGPNSIACVLRGLSFKHCFSHFSDSVFRLVFNKSIVSKTSVALKDLYA